MKVLSFSLDPQVLDPSTTTAKRVSGYGQYVEKYTIIVPSAESKIVVLSPTVTVYGTGGTGKLGQLIKLYNLASQLLKKESYDVVSTQDPYYVGLAGYVLSVRHHIGFEIQVLGLYNLNFIRVQLARFLLPRAGSMRILSEGLKTRLLSKEFGMQTDERMRVVPIYAEVSTLGFDEASLTPDVRAEFQKNNTAYQAAYGERFNFVTVGRLIPVKNHSLQFQAIETLKADFPNVLLHIVGDGEDRTKLEAEVARRGITEQVVFHGAKYHTELGTYFTQSDCFVLSSDTEGWAMVAIEAATAGLPVIMTDVGCAGSAIINEESGLVVPVGDEVALTAAMRRVLTDEALREKLHLGSLEAIRTIATFEEIASGCVRSWQLASERRN